MEEAPTFDIPTVDEHAFSATASRASNAARSEEPLTPASESHRSLLIGVAIAMLAGGLAWYRLTPALRKTIWAEDGTLFLGLPIERADLTQLFEPYGGYLHVVPRAIGMAIVRLLPLRAYAIAANLTACAITGIIAATVYSCSVTVIPSRVLRLWVSLTTVLLPLAGVEVLANLTNLHSFFLWGAFWALLHPPRSARTAAALSTFLLLATLSEIQTVLLAPVAMWALWRRWGSHQLVVTGCYTAGIMAEVAGTLYAPRPSHPHLPSIGQFADLLGAQVFLPLWSTDPEALRTAVLEHTWLAGAAAIPALLGLMLVLVYGTRLTRALGLTLIGLGMFVFGLSHTLNQRSPLAVDYNVFQSAPILIRYGFVPSLFFSAVVALGVQVASQRAHRRVKIAGWLAVATLFMAAAANFRVPVPRRDPTSSWARQMPGARKQCRETGVGGEATFMLNPTGWQINLPCSLVLE